MHAVAMDSIDVHPWHDPYLIMDFPTKLAFAAHIVAILVFGTIAHLFFMHYERNSGDPQKRGLMNQVNQ